MWMQRAMIGVAVCLGWLAVAFAGAPAEIDVQGLYEGSCKDGKIEARVVAQGKGVYKVYIRVDEGGGKLAKVVLDGKTAGDAVTFEGKAGDTLWKGSYADGAVKGECGEIGTFEAKRVEKKSPTLGKKPPEGAIVLLDGKSFENLVRGRGPWYLGPMEQEGWGVWEVPIRTIAKQPKTWPSKDNLVPEGWELAKDRRRVDEVVGIGEDGSIRIPGGGMNSKPQFEGSFDAHVEFMSPFMPTAHSQGRGNSGVYLPNGQEIQVLDSFGDATYTGGGCGGLYAYKDPDAMESLPGPDGKEFKFSLASLPPGQWQTYDIEYRVQMKDGKPVGKPRLTVYHNGIKIHDNVELKRDHRKGRFHFQDHGNPVRYRNIWVLPVEAK
jgi:hypothetical protein